MLHIPNKSIDPRVEKLYNQGNYFFKIEKPIDLNWIGLN